jgi:hypothetical protein
MFNLNLGLRALVVAGVLTIPCLQAAPASAAQTGNPNAIVNALSAGPARAMGQTRMHPDAKNLPCGVQWTASIPPYSSQLWYTFNWPAASYMNWSLMTDSITSDIGAGITDVHTQLSDSSHVTYWITVTNESGSTVNFEGRYCFLHS